MKTLKIVFLRFLAIALVIILILYFGLFFYYRFAWKNHYSKQQVENLIEGINSAPTLSDSFYVLYDKIHNDRHEHITTRYFENFWTEFLMLNHPLKNNWQYVTANLQTYNGHRYKIAPISLAFRINRQASPEKCFDYIMTERYRQYCKEFKIADMITNLADKEQILKFIIANEQPRYYRFHPTKYKTEIDSIRKLTLN